MQAQIKQWGNSQGIRISKEILQSADLSVEDVLDGEFDWGEPVGNEVWK